MMGSIPITSKRIFSALAVAIVFGTIVWIYSRIDTSTTPQYELHNANPASFPAGVLVAPVAKYFIDFPLNGPRYGEQFGELGKRVQILEDWASRAVADPSDSLLRQYVEEASLSMFPFIRNPLEPNDPTPLAMLRRSYVPGSHGIVIPVGIKDFRFACHLILALRNVLHSTLPIQIAYSGDDDLPADKREILMSLDKGIELLTIAAILDDGVMKIEKSWAIKPFAALASTFEKVIVVDADAVFLQPPEELLSQAGWQETGTLLFHDRLLWQHGYQERHKWWKQQMKHQEPSAALLASLVWTEDYAEEADSGVVVLDKARLPVFMGLLHICWQNTKPVRDEATYKMTYGDKESWWFGLELCGVPHVFEKHYGAVLGEVEIKDDRTNVCGFTIAHVDEKDRLIWYNGSLLKNKVVDSQTFQVPTHWMIDAVWDKGATKADMSCMRGGNATRLSAEETHILERSVEIAKEIDATHSLV
jgi:alpha 1,3-mannosyltransferase